MCCYVIWHWQKVSIMPKRKTSFNSEWTKEHEFISKSSRDSFHGFCTLCRCYVDVSSQGKATIERHAGTDKHKNNKRAAGTSSMRTFFELHWWATLNIYIYWVENNTDFGRLITILLLCCYLSLQDIKRPRGSGGLEAMMTEGLLIVSCYRGWMWSCLKTGLLHTHRHWRQVPKRLKHFRNAILFEQLNVLFFLQYLLLFK